MVGLWGWRSGTPGASRGQPLSRVHSQGTSRDTAGISETEGASGVFAPGAPLLRLSFLLTHFSTGSR